MELRLARRGTMRGAGGYNTQNVNKCDVLSLNATQCSVLSVLVSKTSLWEAFCLLKMKIKKDKHATMSSVFWFLKTSLSLNVTRCSVLVKNQNATRETSLIVNQGHISGILIFGALIPKIWILRAKTRT